MLFQIIMSTSKTHCVKHSNERPTDRSNERTNERRKKETILALSYVPINPDDVHNEADACLGVTCPADGI